VINRRVKGYTEKGRRSWREKNASFHFEVFRSQQRLTTQQWYAIWHLCQWVGVRGLGLQVRVNCGSTRCTSVALGARVNPNRMETKRDRVIPLIVLWATHVCVIFKGHLRIRRPLS